MKEIMGFKATRPKSVRIKALPTRPSKKRCRPDLLSQSGSASPGPVDLLGFR